VEQIAFAAETENRPMAGASRPSLVLGISNKQSCPDKFLRGNFRTGLVLERNNPLSDAQRAWQTHMANAHGVASHLSSAFATTTAACTIGCRQKCSKSSGDQWLDNSVAFSPAFP